MQNSGIIPSHLIQCTAKQQNIDLLLSATAHTVGSKPFINKDIKLYSHSHIKSLKPFIDLFLVLLLELVINDKIDSLLIVRENVEL